MGLKHLMDKNTGQGGDNKKCYIDGPKAPNGQKYYPGGDNKKCYMDGLKQPNEQKYCPGGDNNWAKLPQYQVSSEVHFPFLIVYKQWQMIYNKWEGTEAKWEAEKKLKNRFPTKMWNVGIPVNVTAFYQILRNF